MKAILPLCLAALAIAPLQAKPLKVFILAGQSNMQGHAKQSTFDYISKDPKTADLYKLMTNDQGEPASCDKVWISYVSEGRGQEPTLKEGKLGFGFGAGDDKIGPEFTFGLAMEKALDEPILIIKTAWGGKNLHTQFRSPSAGDAGEYYKKMVDHVNKVLADPGKVCPAYDPKEGYEIAGFVWFQGWNDMTDRNTYPQRDKPGGYDLYSETLRHFIRDVRKEFKAPEMPFVIGVMGTGGILDLENPNRYTPIHHNFRMAMAAPAKDEEFKGNVVAVLTEKSWDPLQDQALEKKNKINGDIKKMEKEGKKFTREEKQEYFDKRFAEELSDQEKAALEGVSNFQFHYHGSAKVLGGIGVQFAEALIPLVK
ncbi:MAG: sialate O-acetylesterase [Akkermansiaceae bacterium]|nr:sialate O-acetylesterase [Akkermansiaceae bacterium]